MISNDDFSFGRPLENTGTKGINSEYRKKVIGRSARSGMSKVAIIVPVYNAEPYIHRCVNSILAQTFMDFELILVDDGSSDRSGEICDEYEKTDARIHVIHQPNKGQSAARNIGIDWAFANSDCKWLNFVDSDDWVHPVYLEAMMALVEKYGIAIVSHIGAKEETLEIITAWSYDVWKTSDYFVSHYPNAILPWGKVYKKSDFSVIRYPEGRVYEDAATTYKILFQYDFIPVINEPLYAYYLNPFGTTAQNRMPQRIDLIDAMEGQVAFFVSRGMRDVAKVQYGILLNDIRKSIVGLMRSDRFGGAEKQKYFFILLKRFIKNGFRYMRFWPYLVRRSCKKLAMRYAGK